MIWKICSKSIKEMCSEGQVDKRLAPLEEKRRWALGNGAIGYICIGCHKCEEKQISLRNFSEQSL